ncbi:UNVERIFIED_CONTAM: Calmodulin-binding transcription activator 6 [Sesamum radiatum]|uniref:Calmodulin-binding transcription activator 6 n=1 Tax=Sesamum radiatum TaxID=300843 RepID=A0AAW2UCG1_SESRA
MSCMISTSPRPSNPHKEYLVSDTKILFGTTAGFELRNQYQMNSYRIDDDALSNNKASPESSANSFSEPVAGRNSINYTSPNNISYQTVEQDMIVNSEIMISGLMPSGGAGSLHNLGKDGLQSQDSFGRWVTHIIAESPESVDDHALESSNLAGHQSFTYPLMDSHHPSPLGPIFTITDVSPAWAFQLKKQSLAQFHLRNKTDWEEFQLQMRLAHLLFSSSKGLSIYSTKLSPTALKEAKAFAQQTSHILMGENGGNPFICWSKAKLVTDPTPQNPKGLSAHELASENGYDGLAAYLAEKALVAQFDEMTLAGNVSGSLQTTTNETVNPGNFSEEELYLKDTLAAYRTAADAAARIQTAFREHSLKVRTKVVESSNPELEARNIVAAMKIQHAFRKYETRKKMVAAARIQYRFRTWKIRNEFLNMRRQAIKIQAMFRGYQVRRQYRKIVWSVGIFEKAVLRWRLKRKGFRGLQVQPAATPRDPNQESDVEEDFFQASRKQAEERVEESVIRVQAMFRSKQAQEAYRRMKLEHNKAKVDGSSIIMSFFRVRSVTNLCSVQLEYEGLLHPDLEMGKIKEERTILMETSQLPFLKDAVRIQ